MKDYVARFEQTETKMKNADMKMPDKVLALHIMMKSNKTSTRNMKKWLQ